MDLSRTRVVLREREVIDVADLALRFVVEHGGGYAKTAALVLPPFVAASVLVSRAEGWVAGWLFALFTATFAGAPFTVLASRLVFEDDVRVLSAIGVAARATWRLFRLRVATFWLGNALIPIGVGIWFLTASLFVVEVTVLERAAPRAAIARSRRIAGRESGVALMALLLLTLLHVTVVLVADVAGRTVISAIFESRPPAPMWTDGWSALSLLGFWLFVPYAATARFFYYLDVRTRSEGWDIQTRFTALASRALPEARSAA